VPPAPGSAARSGRGATAAAGAAAARTPRARPALTSRAAVLALVVCVIALSLAYPLREYVAQRAEIAQLREEQDRAQQSVADLQERSEQLRDPLYIEREARDRLHYRYPGERTYVVISGADEPAEDPAVTSDEPWFTRLWQSVKAADAPGD
jgi:cell division protein FtsB